eukprot:scaffold239447_cov45-Prasinocladus_malaysianus.AAC.1
MRRQNSLIWRQFPVLSVFSEQRRWDLALTVTDPSGGNVGCQQDVRRFSCHRKSQANCRPNVALFYADYRRINKLRHGLTLCACACDRLDLADELTSAAVPQS